MIALTPDHMKWIGVGIVVLIGLWFVWWVLRRALPRRRRSDGQTAYWLTQERREEIDEDDDGLF